MNLQIDEGQRQVLILALAKLSLSRPGWHSACLKPLAEKLEGGEMYEQFRAHGPDPVIAGIPLNLDPLSVRNGLECLQMEAQRELEGSQLEFVDSLCRLGLDSPTVIVTQAAYILAMGAAGGLDALTRLIRACVPWMEAEMARQAATKLARDTDPPK